MILIFVCVLLTEEFPSWIFQCLPEFFTERNFLTNDYDFWIGTWFSVISTFISLFTALTANKIAGFSFQQSFSITLNKPDFVFKKITDIDEAKRIQDKFKKYLSFSYWKNLKKPKAFYQFSLDIGNEAATQMLSYNATSITIKKNESIFECKNVFSEVIYEANSPKLRVFLMANNPSVNDNIVLDNLLNPQVYTFAEDKEVSLKLGFDVSTRKKDYKQNIELHIKLLKDTNNSEFAVHEYFIKINK